MTKRGFDLAISTVLLITLSPLLLLIAIVIALDSRGPVLFRQQRVGRDGRIFRIHKFRTMRGDGPYMMISGPNDPRVTRVGRILRLTKLDELPQLLDVIGGTMSLVGPRPEVPRYVELWPDDLRSVILSVRPGISDPMTIELRNESRILADHNDPEQHYVDVLLPRKAAAYAQYVRTRSMSADIMILFKTVERVLDFR